MALGSAQVKGKIKNLAKSNKADARILMRIYMMERFLEIIIFVGIGMIMMAGMFVVTVVEGICDTLTEKISDL